MICGMKVMLLLCVDNWNFLEKVQNHGGLFNDLMSSLDTIILL